MSEFLLGNSVLDLNLGFLLFKDEKVLFSSFLKFSRFLFLEEFLKNLSFFSERFVFFEL